MRKVVLSVGVSLDGYIARTDGAVDCLYIPKGFSMPFVLHCQEPGRSRPHDSAAVPAV